MLTRTEKEQRVIELYQQGKTIREIAQEVHMSFADIGSIIRKFTKLDDDNKPQEKDPITSISKDTQAFALFSEGKRPIEVAIKLDLGADIVGRLYQQFWRLEGLYQLNQVYKEIRRYLPSFLKLFSMMKQEKMMSEKDVVDALKFGKELPHLKDQFQFLIEEIERLEYKRNSLRTALSALQNQIFAARDSLKLYQSALDEAHKKLAQLEKIKNNNKNYQQIEKLAEQKANDILSNRKAILTTAVISVLAALKNETEKQLVIYDLFYNNKNNNCYPSNNNDDFVSYATKIMSSSSPENYLPSLVHRKVFEIAEKFYDILLKVAVNNTVYPLSHSENQQPDLVKPKN
jgi:hypothetical protein